MVRIFPRFLVFWALFLGVAGVGWGQDSFEDLKLAGAKFYSEKSYGLAYEAWAKAAAMDVPEGERRNLEFYLADSRWRSGPDEAAVEAARQELEGLLEADGEDVIAAEALESLGDSWLALGPDGGNWQKGWEYYERALAKWAAATDLDAARARYLGIVWKATGPPMERAYGREVPLNVLANALEIAVSPENKARAHYFLGESYWRRGGDPFSLRRAGREWQAALDEGEGTAVYEAALFHLAEWNERAGKSVWTDEGGLVVSPDLDRALELYRRFLKEFPEGKSQFSEQAKARIDDLTRPTLDINTSYLYLPGVEPLVTVSWRNAGKVDLVAYRVDLVTAFRPTKSIDPGRWLDAVKTDGAAEVGKWSVGGKASRMTETKETPVPGAKEAGTYLVVATSGKLTSRTLVTVSGAAAVMQSIGGRAVVMVADARSGAVVPGSELKLWRATRGDRSWTWKVVNGVGGDDKTEFDFDEPGENSWMNLVLVGAAAGQPVVADGSGNHRRSLANPWEIMVYADRSATRPGEMVRWKLIGRKRAGGALATPGGETLRFEVVDPRGETVSDGEVKLTPFGTAWGEFRPDAKMPLGEYSVRFFHGDDVVGSDTLFRLEEYRLPEYKVSVGIPVEAGESVRLGDSLGVEIGAEYYFGGAVSDAEVKVVVREAPWQRWVPYGGMRGRGRMDRSMPTSQPGRVIREDTVRTGPDGKARIEIATPIDSPSDLEYTVEVRVVDATGREVVGRAGIVVARQGYFVDLVAERRVVFLKDPVTVKIAGEDANGGAVAAKGTVTVSREIWQEVWLDPRGREVTGAELAKLRRDVFPPSGEAGWRLKRREYVGEEVKRVEVALGADGTGSLEFTPESEGFYRARWQGRDGDGPPVTAEASVWAASKDAQLTGYHAEGVEIVVDARVERGRKTIPVLVATEASGRDVLLTVHAGGEMFRAEVVHVEGEAALVELPVEERLVPNVFVSAALVQNLEIHAATEMVEVPPYERELKVELMPERLTVLPGEEGTFGIRLTDAAGEAVAGELSLGVVDEAVSAIQEDYAGDPLEFFFGQDRGDEAQLMTSMSQRSYWVEPTEIVESVSFSGGFGSREYSAMADQDGPESMDKSFAMPMAAAAPMARSEEVIGGEAAAVTVRSDFRAVAFWKSSVETDANGFASVSMRYPESLTTWVAKARAVTKGAEFGMGEVTTQTTKPLIARLQTPRFLVVGDTAVVAGVVNDRTGKAVEARAELKVEGLEAAPEPKSLEIEAGGSARADWVVKATEIGSAKLTLTAVGGDLNDGLAKTLPVEENGIEVSAYAAGKAVGEVTEFGLTIPAERREGSESLTISVTPSLAAAALDAIPYLIEYPYGCVEQTMSRFLPAVVTARTLRDLGLDEAAVVGRMFGGIDPGFLPAVATGQPGVAELDSVVEIGLDRLRALQRDDGSWPWWGGGEGDEFMTVYVVWGLRQAEIAGVEVGGAMIERGSKWLRSQVVNATNDPDRQSWILHALAAAHSAGTKLSAEENAAVANVWGKRDQLSAYGRALFTLAVHGFGDAAKADVMVRNLRDGVAVEDQPGVSAMAGAGEPSENAIPTAHWGSDGAFWRWQDGGVEATAFALQALLAVDPGNELVEPAMNWLVKNRRGGRWSNTRDTAVVVLAMGRYLATTKELGRSVSFEVAVNGRVVGEVKEATALDGMMNFDVDPAVIVDGANQVTIKRTGGDGPLYVAAEAAFFSLEQPIPARGNEFFVKREYFLLQPKRTLLDGYRYDRAAWAADQRAQPSDRVEVVLTLEAKNDLEYLVVEDLKPAGLEAVQGKSGMTLTAEHSDGTVVPIYCELRDRNVALFASRLKQGIWTIKYDLRAETAGDFSALPAVGHAMYAPEVRGNSVSRRVLIGGE